MGLSFDETRRDEDETLTVKHAVKHAGENHVFDVSLEIIFSEHENANSQKKVKTDEDLERLKKNKEEKSQSIEKSI